jgi:hypothetical protein
MLKGDVASVLEDAVLLGETGKRKARLANRIIAPCIFYCRETAAAWMRCWERTQLNWACCCGSLPAFLQPRRQRRRDREKSQKRDKKDKRRRGTWSRRRPFSEFENREQNREQNLFEKV